jgi:hypothetical protein
MEVRRTEENREGRKQNKLLVRLRVRQTVGPTPIIIAITAPPPYIYIYSPIRVLGTVGSGVSPLPARLDDLPSAGTSLLDYKRGVPIARPHGGQDKGRNRRP